MKTRPTSPKRASIPLLGLLLGGYATLTLLLYTDAFPRNLVAPMVLVVVGWGLFAPLLVMTYRGSLAPWAARAAAAWFSSGIVLEFLLLPELARFRLFSIALVGASPLLFSPWWPEAHRSPRDA